MIRTLLLLSIVGLSGKEERILAYLENKWWCGLKVFEHENGEGLECMLQERYETHVAPNSVGPSVE